MLKSVDFSGRPFHFIGIGGIGMSALAYILAKRKFPVSGSDLRSSRITQHLQELGAHIFWQQEATNLEFFQVSEGSNHKELPIPKSGSHANPYITALKSTEVDSKNGHSSKPQYKGLPQVICSTAIHPDNREYQAALALGCPILHRSDLLAALMQEYQSIAVAGTHGKTTTSSLIGYMLLQAGLDPTIVVGGEVHAWEGNARLGQGPYLVAEADESDKSLVKFSPQIGVITNIELDHIDHYETLDEVIDTFKTFAGHCHTLVSCFDCPTIREWMASSQAPFHQPLVSYSLQLAEADYTVNGVTYRSDGTTAQVWERGQILGQLNLKLLGRHNLSNALAAVAVGRLLGLDFATIAQAIATFEGACRRFECRGKYNNILFIDDYAHHPSEIRETLAAGRLQIESSEADCHPRKRIVAVFQPHRYSRTLAFLTEFSQAFTDADIVISTDIYSAGEPDPGRISGQQLADLIAVHHTSVYYQPSLRSAADFLKQSLKPGDLVIFLAAGNLNQIIPEVMASYQNAAVQNAQEVALP
jgi:UDP-N-acetylmuramate--alanine ligase